METWNQSTKNWNEIGQSLLAPSLKLAEDLGAQSMALLQAQAEAQQAWVKRLQAHGTAALSAGSAEDLAKLFKSLFDEVISDTQRRSDEASQQIKDLAAGLERAQSDTLDQCVSALNRAAEQLGADANTVFVSYLDQVEKALDLLTQAAASRADH